MRNQAEKKRRLQRGLILLYEDRDILVVEKPSGLLSIASETERNLTAYWIIAEYLRHKGEKRRPAVVHRLDRDTSGVMLFAKSEEVKRKIMGAWNEVVSVRRYTALAEGVISGKEGCIDAPLGKGRSGRMTVQENGLRAVTRWKLLLEGRYYSLLNLELETGRMNQIRAHLSYIGHPVAGDTKYGSRSNPLKRLALHADFLAFYHPRDGRLLEFKSPVPAGFRGACV